MTRLADSSGKTLDYVISQPLSDGSGGFGIVFDLLDAGSLPTGMVFKEYKRAEDALHLQGLLAHLAGLPDLCARTPAVPVLQVTRSDTRTVGLVMRKIEGEQLSLQAVARKPLATKLKLALQLVVAVGMLHADGIVHGDINEQNILVRDDFLNLIDIDSCGVLQSNSDQFHPHLRPAVKGKPNDPVIMAHPVTRTPVASIQTDWVYMAVMLNLILLYPASPLNLLGRDDDEVIQLARRWPPPEKDLPPRQHKQLSRCVTALKRLDPQLQRNFKVLFDRGGKKHFEPEKAIPAQQWALDLYRSWKAVTDCANSACPQSGTEYVALDGRECPFCDGGALKWGRSQHGRS
jgi:serine/threonine protein kinase